MRKTILLIATALSAFGYVVVADQPDKLMKASGAHPESTNAPGEQTCAQSGCHVNATISPGDGVNTFQLDNTADKYTPGATHTIKIRAEHAGTSRFGFEVVALDKDNKNIGTWEMTSLNRTQQIPGTVAGAKRYYVTHTFTGTAAVSPGVGEWSFNWTAPKNYTDSVKFYYVTNATNNDGTNKGDALFVSAVAFAANPPNSIEESNATTISIYPNPATEKIVLKNAREYQFVEIYDVAGKLQLSQNNANEIYVRDLASGQYFIHFLKQNRQKKIQSFVKQ